VELTPAEVDLLVKYGRRGYLDVAHDRQLGA
jgi:hypothetical protein